MYLETGEEYAVYMVGQNIKSMYDVANSYMFLTKYFVVMSIERGYVISRQTGGVVAKVPGLYGYNPDTKN